MMNPEVKTEFVAELLSGNYEQGRGALKTYEDENTATYCCLGVLSEIAVREGISLPFELHLGGSYGPYWAVPSGTGGRYVSMPTLAVQDWAGLTYSETNKLAEMNDVERKTFAEIAEWVATNL